MKHQAKMGSPLPFGAALKPDLVVTEAGNFDADDGIRIVLSGANMVVMGAVEGISFTVGVDINDLLEAIQAHTRAHES